MSQETLGKKVGVTFQQIQKYENGVNHARLGRLKLISQALETDLHFFIDIESGKARPLTDFEKFVASKIGSDLIKLLMVLSKRKLQRITAYISDELDEDGR